MAPVVPLADLITNRGMQRTEARRLKDSGFLSGLLYVPRPPQLRIPADVAFDEEFTAADYVVCVYAITTVHQSILDVCARVARMSQPAQKLLNAALIAQFTHSLFDPETLEDPDMSCSWTHRAL
jgi:hypothetical protein